MATTFEMGIPLSIGFSLNSKLPLDTRAIVQTKEDLLTMPDMRKYQGMRVYVVADNTQFKWNSESKWEADTGTFLHGSGAPSAAIGKAGDLYIDDISGNIYLKIISNEETLATSWEYIASFKGVKGDQGIQGPVGTRGTLWFTGDRITGTSIEGVAFPASGLGSVLVNDQYLNTTNGNTYRCSLAGDAEHAEWIYTGNIRGPQGLTGEKGGKGDPGQQGEQGEQGVDGTKIYSGDRLYGDTGPSGKVFAAAAPDGMDYRLNDFYLSNVSGDMYIALSGGLINEVIWLKTNNINGRMIYTGTAITGEGTNIPANTGITFAKVGDVYINNQTNIMYQCTQEGTNTVALWSYMFQIKGAKGDKGDTGEPGKDGDPGVIAYTEVISLTSAGWTADGSNGFTKSYTIVATPLTDDTIIQINPRVTSYNDILNFGITVVSQNNANNTILFRSTITPTKTVVFDALLEKYVLINPS